MAARLTHRFWIAAGSCALAGPCAGQGGGSFRALGDLAGGDFLSRALAVSADGSVIVGLGSGEAGELPFRWSDADGLLPLALLPGTTSGRANGISGDGLVIVGRCGDRSVRWAAGMPIDLVTFGDGAFSSANGVSRDGMAIVGNAFNGDFSLPDTWPYRWTASGGSLHLGSGAVTAQNFEGYGALAASADGAVIVGNEGTFIYDAFRWTGSGLVSLGFLPFGPQMPLSSATACSANGSILAGWSVSIPGRQAFRWMSAEMVGIGDLPGGVFSSEANGISGDGAIIVGRGSTDAGSEAFLWSAATGMRSLRAELLSLGTGGLDGWILTSATAVSADGRTIVGYGTNPAGNTEAWSATLPSFVGCYVNCDGSTAAPAVNAMDFACFLGRFGAGDSYANCDGSTTPPVLNVLDFICFLNRFTAGCS